MEPSTPLGRRVALGARPAPDLGLQADMFRLACDLLGGAVHYEVSNWARPGSSAGTTSATGSAGRTSASAPRALVPRRPRRWWNVRPPEEYLRQVEAGRLPVGGEERLEPSDAYLEEVFLRLRSSRGSPPRGWSARTAEPFLRSGLLRDRRRAHVPTERGMLLLNELVLALAG